MVLGIRDMGERVDEAHSAVEILEFERALQALGIFGNLPILMQLLAQEFCLRRRQRRYAAFTGHAFLGGQFLHDGFLLYVRSMYRSTSSWNSSAIRSPLSVT